MIGSVFEKISKKYSIYEYKIEENEYKLYHGSNAYFFILGFARGDKYVVELKVIWGRGTGRLSERNGLIVDISNKVKELNNNPENFKFVLEMKSIDDDSPNEVCWCFRNPVSVNEIENYVEYLSKNFEAILQKDLKNASEGLSEATDYEAEYRSAHPTEWNALHNDVVFLPWIGENYCDETKRPFKERILVIADSHYCDNDECKIDGEGIRRKCGIYEDGWSENRDVFRDKCCNNGQYLTINVVRDCYLSAFSPENIPSVSSMFGKDTGLEHGLKSRLDWWWDYYIIGEHYLRPLVDAVDTKPSHLDLWKGISFCNFMQTAYNKKGSDKYSKENYEDSKPMIEKIINCLKPDFIICLGDRVRHWVSKCNNVDDSFECVPHPSARSVYRRIRKQDLTISEKSEKKMRCAEAKLREKYNIVKKMRLMHFLV